MFHRVVTPPNKDTSNDKQEVTPNTMEKKTFRNRVESSAVERYAKSQDEVSVPENLANQNNDMQMHIYNNTEINHEKEVNQMNNPEPQAKDNSPEDAKKPAVAPQGRDVNIPGNNFQRPGAAAAPQQPGRPAYPGSYAGANPAANNPYASQGAGNGRKLVIGQGITLSGEIEACEHLIVEGTIEATLKGANVLDVSESGAFLGTVEIDEANIAGRFEGDITVKGRLTIEATGQVVGSISYKELSMEAGAVIDGSVSPIGSTNAATTPASNKKAAAPKAKKAPVNNGAELPFSDKAQAAE